MLGDEAFGFIVGGLFWLFATLFSFKNEDEFTERFILEERLKKELPSILYAKDHEYMWMDRMTYKHPVLMRLPGVVAVLLGVGMLVVDWLR